MWTVPRSRFPSDRIYRPRKRNLPSGVVSTFEYHSGSRPTRTGPKGQRIVTSTNEPPELMEELPLCNSVLTSYRILEMRP